MRSTSATVHEPEPEPEREPERGPRRVRMTPVELTVVVLAAVAGGAVQATLGFGGSFIMVPAVAVLLPVRCPPRCCWACCR